MKNTIKSSLAAALLSFSVAARAQTAAALPQDLKPFLPTNWEQLSVLQVLDSMKPKIQEFQAAQARAATEEAAKKKAAELKASLDRAFNADIAKMFDFIPEDEGKSKALFNLCKAGCPNLSAESAGKILGSIDTKACTHTYQKPVKIPYEVSIQADDSNYYETRYKNGFLTTCDQRTNFQLNVINTAILPWALFTSSEMNQFVLPELDPSSRSAAMDKWIAAQSGK
jgi:hypothetical protein